MMNPLDRIRKSYHGEATRLLARLHELRSLPSLPGVGYEEEIRKIQASLEALKAREPSDVAWKTVQRARHHERPQTLDYIAVSYTHLRAHETVLDLVCRL